MANLNSWGKMAVSTLETMTVGSLKKVVENFDAKLQEDSVKNDDKLVKKLENLKKKYQITINKTTLLYRDNKKKEALKGYKLNQLSFAKIQNLLGKETFVNDSLTAQAWTQHTTENVLLATGAATALIGIANKIGWENIGNALGSVLKFLFTDGMAPITIGVAAVAGVIAWKVIRQKRAENAAIKEQVEADAFETTAHEEEVGKAATGIQKDEIAQKAFSDPMLRQHLEEMAYNTRGAYTPTQMKNAQEILAMVSKMEVTNEKQSQAYAIEGLLSNPNSKLAGKFDAYLAGKAGELSSIDKFGSEAENAASVRASSAVAVAESEFGTDSGLDATKLTALNGMDESTLITTFMVDGKVNEGALQAALQETGKTISTTSEAFKKVVKYIEDKTAKAIFDQQKAAALDPTDPAYDPKFAQYTQAQTRLASTPVAEPAATALTINMAILDPKTNQDLTNNLQLQYGSMKAAPQANKGMTAAELAEKILTGVDLKRAGGGAVDRDTIKHDLEVGVAKTIVAYIKDQAERAESENIIANANGTSSKSAANDLYNGLVDQMFGADKAAQADFKKKYPDMAAVEAAFGTNIKNAEQVRLKMAEAEKEA